AAPFGSLCVMLAARSLPAMVSSVGFLATPATGLLLSTLFLGEPVTPDLIAGSALILGGVGLAAWPSRRR
ncbi:MAG TPA: EamA family transporter, partial [Acetobacteraceae bacterium]|nr:EamA family transporter [Acetobacteraceae bacterium]